MSAKPYAEKHTHLVHFGQVDGQDRGTDIMSGSECIDRDDPFFWLRSDKRDNPDVLNHLKKENEYTQSQLFSSESDNELFESLQKELKQLIKEDDQSIKSPIGNQNKKYWHKYYYDNVAGKSHIVHNIERIDKTTNESTCYTLLDENIYKDPDNADAQCDISGFCISYNHKYMLFGLDTSGDEIYNVYMFDITDLSNKVQLEHHLPPIYGANFGINKDETLIFYVMTDEADRQNSLHVYDIKSCVSKKLLQVDELTNSVDFSFTTDREYLLVTISSFSTNTIYYMDMCNGFNFETLVDSDHCSYLKLVQLGKNEDKYTIDKIGNYFVILTNKFGNPDFIPMYCEIGENVGECNWKLINKDKLERKLGKTENDYMYYEDLYVTKDYVTCQIRYNGVTMIVSTKFNHKDADWKILSPSDETCVFSVVHSDRHTNQLIVYCSSLTVPSVYINYNIDTQEKSVLKEKQIPTYNKDNYISKRLYAPSHDGTKIPVSIVYKKEYKSLNGYRPLHLYGYGSYGITIDSTFDRDIIPLLDRGYIYAIAHVRGGSFMGYQWYQQGKMLNKMNTFLDFKAVAEYLVDKKYTTCKLMSCEGASAGGLLVGYCITHLPKLFNAVIAKVPFVDVLSTMCDPTIPLTAPEWEQWGNPNNKKYFDYMSQYSPYDNIKDNVDYPNYYITGGLNDPRVQYWEPAKFVAKLRYAQDKSSEMSKIQVLDIKMNDGHFCSSDRYKKVKELAKEYLFLLKSITSAR